MSSLNSGTYAENVTGVWEYIDVYSTVRILVSGGACQVTLDWANEDRGNTTNGDDITVSETITVAGPDAETHTRTVIGKQLRVSIANVVDPISLSVFYLDSSNLIKIIDDRGSVVDISEGGLNMLASSTGGDGLKSTSTSTSTLTSTSPGPALYTALTDSNGTLLKTEGGSLSVALRDNTAENIDIISRNLLVNLSDTCGFAVAATNLVTGAAGPGAASFLALPTASYLTDYSLNMSVALRDSSGLATPSNGHPTGHRIAMKLIEDDVSYSFTFDVSTSINNYHVKTVLNRPIMLYDLNCYNDAAITQWITIFDQSVNNFHPSTTQSLMRIAVQAKQTRDIYFPRGIRFNKGLSLIGSVLPSNYDVPIQDNTLFMSGVYSPFTEPISQYVSPIPVPDPTPPIEDPWAGVNTAGGMHLTYVITAPNTQVQLAVKHIVGNLYVAWGDFSKDTYTSQSSDIQPHTYTDVGTYEIYIVGEFSQYGNIATLAGVNRLTNVVSFGTLAKLEVLDNAFRGANNLQTVAQLPATVTSINYMFAGTTSAFTGPASWNVSKVQYARGLFLGCTGYNEAPPIGEPGLAGLNWANLRDGSEMFMGATSFNQPIGNWVMPWLNDLSFMLNGASSFNRSLGAWQFGELSSFVTANEIFVGSGLSTENYNASLIGWWGYFGNLKINTGRNIAMFTVAADVGASTDEAKTARSNLINELNWRFRDATI